MCSFDTLILDSKWFVWTGLTEERNGMDKKQRYNGKYRWKEQPDGTAGILRVYAPDTAVRIPGDLEGHPVSAVGAYCFSDVEKQPDDALRETVVSTKDGHDGALRVTAGSYLESLVLPDSVVAIQDLAFYNCKKMQKLQIGRNTRKFGSDVFMNCHSLQVIEIRGGIEEPSGAAMVLQQIASEIEIHFMGSRQGSEAVLLYPEYSESYDEIAPAHIFGRNITGEGFRARQLFADGVVQLERYDEILDKIAVEESGLTIGRMALCRLLYPVALRPDKRDAYEEQIRKHGYPVAKYYIDRRQAEILHQMCAASYLQGKDLDEAIQYSVSAGWSEGSAALLGWKQRYAETDRRNRYRF